MLTNMYSLWPTYSLQHLNDTSDGSTKSRSRLSFSGLMMAALICAFWLGPAWSDTISPAEDQAKAHLHIQAAIQRLTDSNIEGWSYRRTVASDGQVITDHHDPGRAAEEHWQLVSVDGQPPSASDLRKYRRNRADHSRDEDDENRYGPEDLGAMIRTGSLVRVASDAPGELWQFAMQSPDGRHVKRFHGLRGELVLHPHQGGQPFIERVSIWNEDTLAPAFGVRFETLQMDVTFIDLGQYVVPKDMEIFLEGRAYLIKDLNNEYKIAFSDMQAPTSATDS